MRKLLNAVEEAKRVLSTSASTCVDIEAFCEGTDLREQLSRAKVEAAFGEAGMCRYLEESVASSVERAIQITNSSERFGSVIFCGGVAKMPVAVQSLRKVLEKNGISEENVRFIDTLSNADEICAIGAATEAAFVHGYNDWSEDASAVSVSRWSVLALIGRGDALSHAPPFFLRAGDVVNVIPAGIPLPFTSKLRVAPQRNTWPLMLLLSRSCSGETIEALPLLTKPVMVPEATAEIRITVSSEGSVTIEVGGEQFKKISCETCDFS
jgi:hypothetical protein